MPNSLKSCLPVLGRILNETPDALYARQRAFVRTGLLKSVPGRGPGSGVHASAETFALFLIGMLTNASVAENGPIAKSIANAGIVVQKSCPLTGAKSFRSALARMLSDADMSERVNEVRVFISGTGQALINYDGTPRGEVLSPEEFAKATHVPAQRSFFVCRLTKSPVFSIETAIPHDIFQKLTKATIALLADTERS
jgi:hypothetical protein